MSRNRAPDPLHRRPQSFTRLTGGQGPGCKPNFILRSLSMFARMLELTVKPEKEFELTRKIKNEILPILKKHDGFVDILSFAVENEPAKIFAISLWTNKMAVEKYEKELYPKVKAIFEPYLVREPIVRLCTVDETVTQKILAVAA
jgi:heme-degrading monooxygenase HmoA